MKQLHRLLPDTLGGRIVLVLLVGLMAFHLGSLWLHQIGTEAMLGTTREAQLAERLVAAKRAVAELPIEERDRTAHALSTVSLDMHWTRAATVQPVQASSARIEALRSRLGELVPEFDITGLRLGYGEDGVAGHQLLGALPLPDGSWLNFSAALFRPPASEHATLLSTTAMAVGILLLGLLVVRLIGRPLRTLSDAADRFGGPGPVVPVPEEGPREVRYAAQAFNRMQGRIDRLIADRTHALAAVSMHLLRRDIQRMHPRDIRRDAILPHLATDRDHLRNAWDGEQSWPQHPICQLPQLHRAGTPIRGHRHQHDLPHDGGEGGGENWAIATKLIRTAILNGVDPQAWLTDVLEQMVSGKVNSRNLASLLPWAWRDAERAELAA